ncbi:MAG TPA: DUF4244 domain-containing protein [Mycobacteriales bacterium]|nr:DUF4244 domain-containing protein [Mycobacteriales bacterium]
MLRWLRARLRADDGMATAEYAVGTLAAVAFAVLLFKIATSPQIIGDMASIFNMAFHQISPSVLFGSAATGH